MSTPDQPSGGASSPPEVDFSVFGPVEKAPLSRFQLVASRILARNWASIPHVTHQDEADITELENLRKELNARHAPVKITPLPFLIKAVVAALKEFPRFNTSLDADGRNLVWKKYFHIGIAVDTPAGLLVAVIRDCDSKSLVTIAQEAAALSSKARSKGLTMAEMSGGCFTISSLGSIGGTGFSPIINAPEVAILGVTSTQWKPRRGGDEGNSIDWRLMVPLSLSYDHRVINGADAARFTRYLADQLQRPSLLLGDAA